MLVSFISRRYRIHTAACTIVLVVDVLIDVVAGGLPCWAGIAWRQLLQRSFDCQADGRSGALILAPVEDELLVPQGLQQFTGNLFG